MASVTSLDQDMRNLRMSRYTPAAANEARTWIEESLGKSLAPGDLLDALKDGVALCELVNLVLPSPGIKFKSSNMPFVQMENISHFLRGCEMPPLSMPAHDRFLTVDLYESKDPAQVMQCLAAFSRQAHALNPSRFRSAIGPKKAGVISPTTTGQNNRFSATVSPTRALSPSITGGSTGSQTGTTRSPAPVTSWSNRADVGSTAPAWSIHQYGWTGGADQGKQGISFGARRQITSQAPNVPSVAEKERLRKEKEAEAERLQKQRADDEQRRKAEQEREERVAREAEEKTWEEETKRHREEERARLAQQKREWEEQERHWKEAEEKKKQEDASMLQPAKRPSEQQRSASGTILRGQTLSQYQREQALSQHQPQQAQSTSESKETADQIRVRELERQLEEARERERQYQTEREERLQRAGTPSKVASERPSTAQSESDLSWTADEREYQRKQGTQKTATPSKLSSERSDPSWQADERVYQRSQMASSSLSGANQHTPVRSSMPESTIAATAEPDVPEPTIAAQALSTETTQFSTPQSTFTTTAPRVGSTIRSPFARPANRTDRSINTATRTDQPIDTATKTDLPIDTASRTTRLTNRTDEYLSSNPAPVAAAPRISSSTEAGDTAQEQAKLRDDRIASQEKTRAGAWASKSLLEREMERERQRQREWEANQANIKDAKRDTTQGAGEGQTWDVNTYGWIKGDSQNRGSSSGSGINVGGRRQIIGPRPQP